MKKLAYIFLGLLFIMCSSTKTGSKPGTKPDRSNPEIQYRDDFRAAGNAEKSALLSELKATDNAYSVLILTKTYKGENIKVSAAGKTVYGGYPITNLKSGIAEKIRIDNRQDTNIYDSHSKKSVIIEAAEAQKHKFIYLMKNPENGNAFTITYSNTLRPLE